MGGRRDCCAVCKGSDRDAAGGGTLQASSERSGQRLQQPPPGGSLKSQAGRESGPALSRCSEPVRFPNSSGRGEGWGLWLATGRRLAPGLAARVRGAAPGRERNPPSEVSNTEPPQRRPADARLYCTPAGHLDGEVGARRRKGIRTQRRALSRTTKATPRLPQGPVDVGQALHLQSWGRQRWKSWAWCCAWWAGLA